MTYNPLGRFTYEYPVEDGFLYIRGLKVSEFIDLSHQGFFTSGTQAATPYVRIALACIEGFDIDGVDEDEEIENLVPVNALVEIGRFVVERLTLIPEHDEEKLRAFVRYQNYMGDHEGQAETYNCQKCLMGGYYSARKKFCGRFTEEEAAEMISTLKGAEYTKVDNSTTQNKYKAKRRKTTKAEESTLYIGGYRFPECPTSWIDEWIWVSGNVLFHSEKSNIPFISGGLAEQPYKLYRAGRIISSESAKIEQEEYDKKNRK